ncbi:molybdopterin-synthase adenylyltransferase MoeB [Marinoscillum furvescens]|uniref:Molybdopterin-synthase adenylyltransferase n=1 Tax=Marinoscillum furvescens DSM 4134 TaxID=1122208 RepID=A0A3D9L6N4_MARFU|nr:molybdopterin-synthase adenylyltransferase MoeB [Marinoscillum furvescens]REE01784.1 adenylyltransferase/sulfurtransferase [Marinoscillum furvescens DSM 4134]
MFSESEKAHYNRQMILPGWGAEKQQLLKDARVLVIGAGGLGCPALQYLAAAGVGTIGIVDGDRVAASNLHRQVLYTQEDIGEYKAEAAAKRLEANNPHVQFDIHTENLTTDNALELLPDYEVVIDGTDNFPTRYLINDACVLLDLPFVYGAITKFEGQVCVFNHAGGPTYRCLFPEPPAPGSVPSCAEIGVIGVLPGLIGTYQALEAIKLITGLGTVRSGELLMINTLDNTQMSISIALNPANRKLTELTDYEAFCGVKASVPEISGEELQSKLEAGAVLVDVREPGEVAAFNMGGMFIPLGQLEARLGELDPSKDTVVICQSGKRSAIGAQQLLDHGFARVWSVKGGIEGVG